jgi:two-component system C4-dicarboxylate transport response regulator DctD
MKIDTVLFVDDEEHLRFAAEQSLQLDGLSAQCFGDAEAALGQLKRDFPGVLVTDIRLPGMDGLTLMRRALEIDPAFPVILVTGQGDVELAVNSMRDGAYDFLEKPFAPAA